MQPNRKRTTTTTTTNLLLRRNQSDAAISKTHTTASTMNGENGNISNINNNNNISEPNNHHNNNDNKNNNIKEWNTKRLQRPSMHPGSLGGVEQKDASNKTRVGITEQSVIQVVLPCAIILFAFFLVYWIKTGVSARLVRNFFCRNQDNQHQHYQTTSAASSYTEELDLVMNGCGDLSQVHQYDEVRATCTCSGNRIFCSDLLTTLYVTLD